jgi:hypothetical protein
MMLIVSLMVPYLCPVFRLWVEYHELLVLCPSACPCMCSLYLVLNALPLSLYLPHCIVFPCLNAILYRCPWKRVDFFVSSPMYMNAVRLVLWCSGLMPIYWLVRHFNGIFYLHMGGWNAAAAISRQKSTWHWNKCLPVASTGLLPCFFYSPKVDTLCSHETSGFLWHTRLYNSDLRTL